jgi:hypothetical protein
VNRTGTALGDAATELGAGELKMLTDDPQQRDILGHLDGVVVSVNIQGDLSHKMLLCLIWTYKLRCAKARMLHFYILEYTPMPAPRKTKKVLQSVENWTGPLRGLVL